MTETTTVLTLGGLGRGDGVVRSFQSWAVTGGRKRVVVDYPRVGSVESIDTGADNLDDALHRELRKTDGRVDVVAASQGAEAVSVWLEKYGDRMPKHFRGRIRFILAGNPRRLLGGVGKIGWDGKPISPTRNDTEYEVLDVARVNDGWANADDWPNQRVTLARYLRLLLGRFLDHADYSRVDLEKCKVREKIGNTTYLVAE